MADNAVIPAGAYIAFGGTVLSTRYRTYGHEETGETVESTAGADTHVTREFTVIDGKASMEMVHEGGTAGQGTVVWEAVKPGNEGTLEWAPEGTATGSPRHYVTRALAVKRTMPFNYRDVIVIAVDFEYSAPIVDTTY